MYTPEYSFVTNFFPLFQRFYKLRNTITGRVCVYARAFARACVCICESAFARVRLHECVRACKSVHSCVYASTCVRAGECVRVCPRVSAHGRKQLSYVWMRLFGMHAFSRVRAYTRGRCAYVPLREIATLI